jgi:hypothetical protein
MKTLFNILSFVASVVAADAATTLVNWSVTTEDVRQLSDRTSSPLSAGTAAPGDGTLLELGYYSSASISNPFLGIWTVMATSTIGDDGMNVAGSFSTKSILGPSSDPLLTTNTPLAIRFYDGTSVGSSTYFNAVSNVSGAWNYVLPTSSSPVIDMVIDKTNDVVFQDGGSGAFRTVLPIPEPSIICLTLIGSLLVLVRRSRK